MARAARSRMNHGRVERCTPLDDGTRLLYMNTSYPPSSACPLHPSSLDNADELSRNGSLSANERMALVGYV